MKTKINSLLGAVLALLVLTLTAPAATQVYDLKTDWSDTQNPNGTWSYRHCDGGLLPNYSLPWGYIGVDGSDVLTRTTAGSAVPGYLEVGDISALPYCGLGIRWTAPANGVISVSGAIWKGSPDACGVSYWSLTRNGSYLSDRFGGGDFPRSAPYDLSFWGSAGPNGLLNIPVQAGDRVELNLSTSFCGLEPSGINFSVTLTTDSVDPVAAIENLALTVVAMNLQNGIENSLDSKLDAALNALVDANVNNDGAACNSLVAFINAVEAQRGKKITSAQADQLIAAAQGIKDQLNCSK
jgi:hypothetical protein